MLISESEIDGLPEDPKERFYALQKLCRDQYARHKSAYTLKDRLQFVVTVLNAAKHCNIDEIKSFNMPTRIHFTDATFDDFQYELDNYNVKYVLEKSATRSKYSILLEGDVLARLTTLTTHLKSHIDKLDMPDRKKRYLREKIEDFEKELTKNKLSFLAVASVVLVIAGAVADMGGAADVVRKVISQIEATIGIAKQEQEKITIPQITRYDFNVKLLPPPEE